MKYQAPIGAADPDDPYIDGNPATGTPGSPVPAKSVEHPMREIVAVIEAAGLTPDEGNLAQLLAAIQGGAGLAQDLSASGYQALPGGLIIQWGLSAFAPAGTTISFPLAFTTSCFAVIPGNRHQGANHICSVDSLTAANFAGYTSSGSSSNAYWFAVGK